MEWWAAREWHKIFAFQDNCGLHIYHPVCWMQRFHCNQSICLTILSTFSLLNIGVFEYLISWIKLEQCYIFKFIPNGGWTSKKNVRFMYQEPIFPKWVSSQQTWSGSSILCNRVTMAKISTRPNSSHQDMFVLLCSRSRFASKHSLLLWDEDILG